ncbi:hypothetical protein ACFP65_05220 [Marinilactibacillus sp. GCM10026970]|uniref:hypothetical protein n=1 Tax=Marinilactibacillus sp. GCM10026970 TaxID=3252642 RepID=UPI003617EF11
MNRKPIGLFKILCAIVLFILALFTLAACQPNGFFDEETTIVKIDVTDDHTEERVATITDQVFITSLIEELESAQTSSTANLDMVNPDYKLLFLNESDKVVREMSYYIEEKTFGVIGRYHYDGELIAVVTELPI